MKKIAIAAVVAAAALTALRRFGPALRERAMRKCEEMFDHMPEDFPPKRMMLGIQELREQNTQILRQLGEQGRQTALAAAERP